MGNERTPPMPHTIYTLGHSTHSIDTVVTMLRNNNVTALIDVRSYPASRRNPQWNHDTLPTQLPTDFAHTNGTTLTYPATQ